MRRVAAEIRGDDGVVAEDFRHQRIRAAAERRREDRALGIDDVDVALSLMSTQLVDLLFEVRIVECEKMRGKIEAHPTIVVAIEAALEIAGDRREPSAAVRTHADRIELERRHAEVVVELPQLGKLLHQRRNDLLRRLELRQRIGDHEGLETGQRVEGNLRDLALVELLDVDAALVGQRHSRSAEVGRIGD